jgi:hypothetical protein
LSNNQPDAAARPFIGRISTPIFILLCLATSLLAAGLFLIATAITIALIDAALNIGTQMYEGPILLLSIAFGFVAPIPWLRKKRRRPQDMPAQTPAAAMPPPLDAAFAKHAHTKAEPDNQTAPLGTHTITPRERRREDDRLLAIASAERTRSKIADFEKAMEEGRPSRRRLVIGGIVAAVVLVLLSFVHFNDYGGPIAGNLGQCDSSWMITQVKKIPLKAGRSSEIEILDITNIKEVSRKQNMLFCTGLGYLSRGKQDIYWNIELIDPKNSNKWYLEISLDPQLE